MANIDTIQVGTTAYTIQDKATATKVNTMSNTLASVTDTSGVVTSDLVTQVVANTSDLSLLHGGKFKTDADLDIADEAGYVVARFADGHIKTKNFDSSNISADVKMETCISGLDGFTATNWTISDGTATTSTTGKANVLKYSTSTFEDRFNLSFDATIVGTSFELVFGKFYAIGGGAIGITSTAVNFYTAVADGTLTLAKSFTLSTTLTSGTKYHIELTKRVTNENVYEVAITNVAYGDKEVVTYDIESLTTADFWGTLSMYLNSGTSATISNFAFGLQAKDDVQLAIVGHSFVEGNSIWGNKDKRFAQLIANELGNESVYISGFGGAKTSAFSYGVIAKELELLNYPKYLCICLGTNDGSDTDSIYGFEQIKTTCKNANVTPIWMTISPDLRSGTNTHDTANNWLLEQDYCCDIRYAFYKDGAVDTSAYLSDNVHPTIETHAEMANIFLAEFKHLFIA